MQAIQTLYLPSQISLYLLLASMGLFALLVLGWHITNMATSLRFEGLIFALEIFDTITYTGEIIDQAACTLYQ